MFNNNFVALAAHRGRAGSLSILAKARQRVPGSARYADFKHEWPDGPPRAWEASMKEHYDFLVWCDQLAKMTQVPVSVGMLSLLEFFDTSHWNIGGFLQCWTLKPLYPIEFLDLQSVSAFALHQAGGSGKIEPLGARRKFSSAKAAVDATFAAAECLERIAASITQAHASADEILAAATG